MHVPFFQPEPLIFQRILSIHRAEKDGFEDSSQLDLHPDRMFDSAIELRSPEGISYYHLSKYSAKSRILVYAIKGTLELHREYMTGNQYRHTPEEKPVAKLIGHPDENGEVLMVAYMNRDAFDQTVREEIGRAHV